MNDYTVLVRYTDDNGRPCITELHQKAPTPRTARGLVRTRFALTHPSRSIKAMSVSQGTTALLTAVNLL